MFERVYLSILTCAHQTISGSSNLTGFSSSPTVISASVSETSSSVATAGSRSSELPAHNVAHRVWRGVHVNSGGAFKSNGNLAAHANIAHQSPQGLTPRRMRFLGNPGKLTHQASKYPALKPHHVTLAGPQKL